MQKKINNGESVRFQIDDGLVRDFATNLVRNGYGIVDTSFNSSIIKLSGEQFVALTLQVIDEEDRIKILATISDKEKEKHQDLLKTKGPIRLFIDSFASSAGK